MAESTRPLPPMTPLANGGWEVRSLMSSTDFTIRGLGLMPSNSIVPVIVVPGIMGTNLRARRFARLGRQQDERNRLAAPGAPVWRSPDYEWEGLAEAAVWGECTPEDRQWLFDAATLEPDDGGPIVVPGAIDGYVLGESALRQRGGAKCTQAPMATGMGARRWSSATPWAPFASNFFHHSTEEAVPS